MVVFIKYSVFLSLDISWYFLGLGFVDLHDVTLSCEDTNLVQAWWSFPGFVNETWKQAWNLSAAVLWRENVSVIHNIARICKKRSEYISQWFGMVSDWWRPHACKGSPFLNGVGFIFGEESAPKHPDTTFSHKVFTVFFSASQNIL